MWKYRLSLFLTYKFRSRYAKRNYFIKGLKLPYVFYQVLKMAFHVTSVLPYFHKDRSSTDSGF